MALTTCPKCLSGLTQHDVKMSQYSCLGCKACWKLACTLPCDGCSSQVNTCLIVRNGKPGKWSPCGSCGKHVNHSGLRSDIVYIQ